MLLKLVSTVPGWVQSSGLRFALNLSDRSRRSLLPNLLVALTSTLVCTIHYFGVFSLALVTASHSILARRTPRAILRGLVPV